MVIFFISLVIAMVVDTGINRIEHNIYMYQSEGKRVVTGSVGDIVASARAAKGWSRQALADETGYSAVMIAKIESGDRLPDERRIPQLARSLGLDPAVLAQAVDRSDRRRSGAPKIVDGMRLAKQNGDRASAIKTRAERLRQEADRAAEELDEKVREFDQAVVSPIASLLSRTQGIPEDVFAPGEIEPDHSTPEFARVLGNAQETTSRGIYALLQAGVLGNGVASMGGVGAPTTVLATGAGLASAASSAAIGTLVDVAATSVNAGALSRAATAGMGVATGTRALTPIVVFPVLAAATAAALASGGRLLAKQQSIQRQIDDAEQNFDKNAEVVRRFIQRASSIGEVLSVAVMASRYHHRTIETGAQDGDVAWSDLEDRVQASVRRLAEIMMAGFTAIALPIGMNLADGGADDEVIGGPHNEESGPQLSPALEVGPDAENDYIDYAIRQVLAQVAR